MHLFVRGGMSLLLIGDFVVLMGSLFVTLFLRYQTFTVGEALKEHIGPFVFLSIVWVSTFFISGLYDRYVSLERKSIPLRVLKIQLVNILFGAFLFFVIPFGIAPKTNLVIYLIVSTILIALWRLYVYPLLTMSKPIYALVIGDSEEALSIAKVFAQNPYFKNVRAFLLSQRDIPDYEAFRSAFHRFVETKHTEMIVADMRDEYASRMVGDLFDVAFRNRSIRFFNLPSMYETLYHRIPHSVIGESWFLEHMSPQAPHYAYDAVKRIVDFCGAFLLLIPAMLLFPFIMFAIWLDDRGSFFYRAERVGRQNAIIQILKFRTMTGKDSGTQALQSTLSVTRVGAFLRKTRLDELPQLINVLMGDLSFIGPRPEIPSLVSVYEKEIPYYNMRHLIKPGLSGWAQINNFDVPRGGVDIPRTVNKLSFDLYYLKNRSSFFDIEIALKTIQTLILRSGT